MKKTIYLIMAFCLFGLCLGAMPAVAAPPAKAVELNPAITAITVKGNKVVPEREILDAVFTRVGDTLVQEKINGDLKAIYALGYFADVSPAFESYAGGTRVVFIVKENPQLKQVVIDGNTVYSTAEITGWLSTEAGQILNFQTLQADIEKINDRYKTDGYILARVANVDTDEKRGILTIKIIEGFIESIALEGNDQTHDDVILRELRTKPGSVLNQERLKGDLRRIFNLGFFSEVNPNFEPGTTKESVVLLLKIKETRTSTINFGGGYGEREGWFGFTDLSINNLMGTGQGLMIRGQGGQQLSTYQFRYTNPWFMPDRFGDHTALTFRRWLTIGRDIYLTEQDAKYNGFDISVGKPLNDFFNISWTLGSELVNPYNASTFEAYQSDTLGLTLSFDTRDFWLNPKQGRYYTLAAKQGWTQAASGPTNFFKLGPDLNNYYPVRDNMVIALHAGAGIGFGAVPFGELFWVGCANTVRGYYPSQAQTGTRKLLFNAEYRLDFSDLFQGVFFADWGGAWNAGGPIPENFLFGWGPGVRVSTPLGPIRLDYGVPGGQAFGQGVMHFSIGQAF